MMFKKRYRIGLLIAVGALVITCVEPYEVETEVFEDALVIDATITDETKKQEILLSRAYLLEEFDPIPEGSANVRIIDDLQNEYLFQETEPGRYLSVNEFAAQIGRSYQLLITTNNGRSYTSEMTQLPEPTPIHDVYASRTINENDEEGMAIFVDFRPSESIQYYRYEYEETYKIIAPQWVGEKIASFNPIVLFLLDGEERVCYNSMTTEDIKIGSTVGPSGDKLSQFRVRFINRNSNIISHRYSILVKQFAISEEAYAHFELLKKFSGQGSLLSQTQPGFFNGNIRTDGASNEKVLGFFDVSSVSTKRIFFNYVDFFPNEPLPQYTDSDCNPYHAHFGAFPNIIELLSKNLVRFYSFNSLSGEILVVPRECADCTVMGSPVVPDFWEE